MKAKKTDPTESDEANAEEIADAAGETPTDVTAPELDARTKQLIQWDDVPSSHGTAAPKVSPDDNDDDENTVAAKLVYEGTDEADRDRRLAAEDPDFEP